MLNMMEEGSRVGSKKPSDQDAGLIPRKGRERSRIRQGETQATVQSCRLSNGSSGVKIAVRGVPCWARSGHALDPGCSQLLAGASLEEHGLCSKLKWILKVLPLEAVSSLHSLQLNGKFFLKGRSECHVSVPATDKRANTHDSAQ